MTRTLPWVPLPTLTKDLFDVPMASKRWRAEVRGIRGSSSPWAMRVGQVMLGAREAGWI